MEQFDCRGLACPQPVMRTRDALAAGTNALEVLVDNEPARENVRRFLEGRGFTVAASQEGPDCWRITASAGESAASAPQQATEASRPRGETNRTLVLITTETIGRGDDGLGAGQPSAIKSFHEYPPVHDICDLQLLGVRVVRKKPISKIN